MITITNRRIKGTEICPACLHTARVASALRSLLKYELGFGGRIIKSNHSDDTTLVTETIVLRYKDTTTFTGPKEEMTYLINAAVLYTSLKAQRFDKDMEAMIKNTKGIPLLLTAAGGGMPECLTGFNYSSIIASYVVMKDFEKAKELVLKYQGENANEIYTALDLILT